MPYVRSVKLHRSVADTLQGVQHALLPDMMKEDPLVGWLLSFSVPGDEQRRPERHYSETAADVLNRELGRTYLQPKMTYYHSALMSLGSQLALAQDGLEMAQSALDPDNLARSLKGANDIDETIGDDWVRNLASVASERWQERLEDLQHAWMVWREEVGSLKASAEEAGGYHGREGLPELSIGLISVAMRRSGLTALGFGDDPVVEIGPALGSLAVMGLISLAEHGRYDSPYPPSEWLERITRAVESSNYDFLKATELQGRFPILLEQHRALAKEYGAHDPFEAYRDHRKPADRDLAYLVAHNKLIGDEHSHWLKKFQSSLPGLDPYILPRRLEREPAALARRIEWGISTADAVLKQGVISQGQFNADRLQYDFNRGWIEPLARRFIGSSDEASKGEAMERFLAFVSAVAHQLTDLGTAIEPPSTAAMTMLAAYVGGDWKSSGWWEL